MTKIAIVGESGFLASRIINEAKNKKIKIKTFSKKNFNLFDKTSIKKLSTKIKIYDRIIFCAAIAPVKNLSQLNDNLVMLNNFLCNIENLEEKYFLYNRTHSRRSFIKLLNKWDDANATGEPTTLP